MPITLSGSGTVSGISAGGLPSGVIQSANLASGVGGKILQVVNVSSTADGSIHCNPTQTLIDIPNQNLSITPSATTSKILISFQQFGETSTSSHVYSLVLKRAISGGATSYIRGDKQSGVNRIEVMTMLGSAYHGDDNDTTPEVAHCSNYVDSPNTTSAITYTLQIQNHESTGYYYYNRTLRDDSANHSERGLSWLTAIEVAA